MFQTPLFTLVAFNMYYRTKIVQSLGWKIYAKKNISKSIAILDVSTAISALQQNIKQKKQIKRKYYNNLNMISQESDNEELNSGENTNNNENTNGELNNTNSNLEGSQFINLISSVSSKIPHSNEAASTSRTKILAILVSFGNPQIFFTVSPPDDNSVIISVYTGIENSSCSIPEMTMEALREKSKTKSDIKFTYPSINLLILRLFQRLF